MGRAPLYLYVAIGGALGAIARVVVGDLVAKRMGAAWPYGTFAINVSGCFVIALATSLLAARGWPEWVRWLVPVGFIGAYTTFSTFALETQRLVAVGALRSAVAYVVLSNALGLVGVWLGEAAGRALR